MALLLENGSKLLLESGDALLLEAGATTAPIPGADDGDLEESCVAELLADAATAAIVGDRIFPGRVPEDVAGASLTYETISSAEGQNHDGPNGVVRARIRFTARSADATEAKAIAFAARAALLPVRGDFHGVRVEWVSSPGRSADYDDSDDGSDDGTHKRVIDLRFRYRGTTLR